MVYGYEYRDHARRACRRTAEGGGGHSLRINGDSVTGQACEQNKKSEAVR